jgi:hypothetical protein
VLFLDDVPVYAERGLDEVDDAEVRDRDMTCGRCGDRQVAQSFVLDREAPAWSMSVIDTSRR